MPDSFGIKMKTIGIIGGLTWLSTVDYYRLINQQINKKLGGVEAGKIILYSINFAEIKILTENNDWDGIAAIMKELARKLESVGADCILIGANTMHKIADEVQGAIAIPLIHIAEETARVIEAKGFQRVALLGTKYTMQMDFYAKKLATKNIETIIPEEADITYINNAIYTEMGKGIFLQKTKEHFVQIINKLRQTGAEAVILGCTEIPILIKQDDVNLPVFDTTAIHVDAAVKFAVY
jgi:aspartate racemase